MVKWLGHEQKYSRVGPGSVTERWPSQKNARKSPFFLKKIKITFFFRYSFQLCQNIGGTKFSRTEDSPKWVKSKRRREKKIPMLIRSNMEHCHNFGRFWLINFVIGSYFPLLGLFFYFWGFMKSCSIWL